MVSTISDSKLKWNPRLSQNYIHQRKLFHFCTFVSVWPWWNTNMWLMAEAQRARIWGKHEKVLRSRNEHVRSSASMVERSFLWSLQVLVHIHIHVVYITVGTFLSTFFFFEKKNVISVYFYYMLCLPNIVIWKDEW